MPRRSYAACARHAGGIPYRRCASTRRTWAGQLRLSLACLPRNPDSKPAAPGAHASLHLLVCCCGELQLHIGAEQRQPNHSHSHWLVSADPHPSPGFYWPEDGWSRPHNPTPAPRTSTLKQEPACCRADNAATHCSSSDAVSDGRLRYKAASVIRLSSASCHHRRPVEGWCQPPSQPEKIPTM